MAATRITTQTITRDGLNPTYEAANVDGHTFTPGDTVFLEVINAGGATSNVLLGQRPDEWTRKALGEAATVTVVAVPAGQRRRIGPLRGPRFGNLPDSVVDVAFLATPTSVTVGVFDLGPLT